MKRLLVVLMTGVMLTLGLGCASTPPAEESAQYGGVVDILYLRDGSKVVGRVTGYKNGKLIVRKEGGKIEPVALEDVSRIDVGKR